MSVRFANRTEAGKALAKKLRHFAFHSEAIVLALPRGGVPVGFEISTALHLPLQIFVVRKLGVPGQEEFAMGAIASGGSFFLNESVVQQLGISEGEIADVIERETKEIERREREYGADSKIDLTDRTIILVDDGLATGSTMRAGVRALRQRSPEKIVVAVPVAPRDTYEDLKKEVDEIVVLMTPEIFFAVGEWYEDFGQTTDEEVRDLLNEAHNLTSGEDTRPVIL